MWFHVLYQKCKVKIYLVDEWHPWMQKCQEDLCWIWTLASRKSCNEDFLVVCCKESIIGQERTSINHPLHYAWIQYQAAHPNFTKSCKLAWILYQQPSPSVIDSLKSPPKIIEEFLLQLCLERTCGRFESECCVTNWWFDLTSVDMVTLSLSSTSLLYNQ